MGRYICSFWRRYLLTIRNALEEVACRTMARLEASEELEIRFGEETLTDLVLLELKQFRCPGIDIIQTSKAKESSQGTDWEWWVGSDATGWLRFAIQAKKLGPRTRYDQLNHKVAGTPQIDLLEKYATDAQAIPMYCLFNRVSPAQAKAGWRCCEKPVEYEQVACTLVPSRTIREAINEWGTRTFASIHGNDRSLPWRCLECSEKGVGAVFPPTVEAAIGDDHMARKLFGDSAIIFPELPDPVRQARQSGRFTRPYEPDGIDGRPLGPRHVAVFDLSAAPG